MSQKILNGSEKILRNVGKGVNDVLDKTEVSLTNLLDNTYVSVSLKVFLALYAAFVAPDVPKNFALLMDSTIVRVIFAALIVYSAIKDPLTAILLSIVFVITLQTAAKYKIYNTSESVLVPGHISWLPSAKQGAVSDQSLQLGNRFVGSVENVGDGLVGGVQQMGSGVVGSARQLGSGLVGGVQQLGSGVVGSAQQFGSGLVGGVQQLGTGVVGSVRQVGSGLVGGVEEVSSGLMSGVSGLGSCLLNSAGQIGSGLVGGVQKFGSGLVGGVQELGGSVVGTAQQLGSGLVGGVQELGGGVVGGVRQLGSGVVGGVRDVSTGVVGGIKSVSAPLGLEHMENPEPEPVAAEIKCAFSPFTSEDQFLDATSNMVPGVSQDTCMQTFNNQYCIQGSQSNWAQGY